MKTRLGLDANLPVTDIVSDAIKLVWLQSGFVLSRFFPFMLVLALIDWMGQVLFPEQSGSIMPFVFMILSMLRGVVFAIACHRFALADTSVPIAFKWSSDHWRYLWRGVQIGLVAGLVILLALVVFGLLSPGLLGAATGSTGGETPAISGPAIVVAIFALMAMMYVTARLSVTLPEIAVGRPSSLRRAWMLSKGNGNRLVAVVWIVPVVLALPFLAAYAVDSTLMLFLGALGTYIATLVSLITLSLSYRFLKDLETESSGGSDTDSSDSGFSA